MQVRLKNINKMDPQKICEKIVEKAPWMLEYVPEQFKTQEMCDKALEETPYYMLGHVPDQFKTQEMCDEVIRSI